MTISPLEQTCLAYYTSGHGKELSITARWYPHAELVMILADKIGVATRKFGRKTGAASTGAARYFVDHMIEQGGWSSQTNDFGGTMHQFQTDKFPRLLEEFNAASPIVQGAASGGETYWADTFAAVIG